MTSSPKILALLAVCAVLGALSASASAAEWVFEPGSQAFAIAGNGGMSMTTNQGETVQCTSSSGGATVNAKGNGGAIELLFHGCQLLGEINTNCTTTGFSAGTVTAGGTWESVYLTDDKTNPGLKITGAGETENVALFKCGFGLVTFSVEGSLIGELEESCGEASKEFSINFESTAHGIQKYMQNTGTGTKADLTAYRNGVARTMSWDVTFTMQLEEESELHCA